MELISHSIPILPIASSSLLLGLILLLLIIHYYYSPFKRASSSHALPPGSFGFPIIGETLPFLSAIRANASEEFVKSRIAKYGPVFKTSLFAQPTVVLSGPSSHRFLFYNENKLVRTSWPSYLVQVLGENVVLAQHGARHKRLRQLLMGCLRPEVLEKCVARVDDLTQRHFADYWDGKEQITLLPLVKMHSLHLACSVLVSLDDNVKEAKLIELFNTFLDGMLRIPIDIPYIRYHGGKVRRAALIRELDDLISERRTDIDSTDKDLLSMLVRARDEDGGSLSDKEIQDNFLFLLLTAHDSTSEALAFVCKFLSENPSCCEKVVQEQLEIAALKKDGQKLSWEDLREMKYTWRVIQETLRLQHPAPGGFRVALKDIDFEGYTIPTGWKIYYSSSFTHRNESYFPDPKTFDPSRFDGAGPAPYTYMPFGGGPHTCPGIEFAKMTMLVFVHHLVRRFQWSAVDPNEGITVDPLPRPAKGLPLRLVRR